ncbi:ATP-dependent nuclease [Pseudothioclava arenosa]|uniref:AAA+ ATPase domain-containing protein n=1 Tax=Pseudothioclava arenosa TaxID=1795308 RepID=A0A2A4CPP2_9RHOB|nr:AAA family ATPase [Pseudothioclava arenosa]PCD77211.1 hypothetical protein CLN94_05455 [Pseudothioclava arenosa]
MPYHYSPLDQKNSAWFNNDNTRQSLTGIELAGGRMRGLTPFTLEMRYPITAIAGNNGTGKTTLLALAACAFHAPRKGFRLPARKTAYYTFRDFFVQAEGELGPEGVEVWYTIRHDKWRGVAPGEARQVRKKAKGGKWNNYDSRVSRTVVYFGVQRVVPYFERSAHVSYRGRFQPAAMAPEIRSRIAQIAGRIIGKTYAEFESFEHGKYALPKVKVGAQGYSGFNMGAGESAVFEILTALFAAGPGCLLVIDEIELGLHERAQTRLVEELKLLYEERKCQIICTTHAHAVLAALPPEGRVFVDNPAGQTRLYPGISADCACGKMGRDGAQELDIFVEDEVAAAILRSALDGELRARSRILEIGSHGSLKRVMAARFMEGKKDCLCVMDGDQRAGHEAAKAAVANHCDGKFGQKQAEIRAWANVRLTYLPGTGWPEKWLFEQALALDEDIVVGWKTSPATCWGIEENVLGEMFETALAAGKHSEFHALAKRLELPEAQVRSDLIAALRETLPKEFEDLAARVRACLA